MDNMKLWQRVCTTDPAAVKPITGKQYQGHSPKPYWLIEKATEVFGPVGIGWGVDVKSERFERLGEFDVLHVAVVSVWFRDPVSGEQSKTFEQMGGTKAAYMTADKKDNKGNIVAQGKLMVDEDAAKKSVTDGMVKCLSMIGFAGDIFSGKWDDSKYVEEARRHYAEDSTQPTSPPKTGAMADMIASLPKLSAEWKSYFDSLAAGVCEQFGAAADAGAALQCIEAQDLSNEQKIHLWARLPSTVRTAVDKLADEQRK